MKIRFKNSLTGLQTILLSVLVLVAVLLFSNVQPYRRDFFELTDEVEYSFLQKGSYTLEITYMHSPADNTIKVYSDSMPNDEGKIGTLYAEERIEHGSGIVRIPFVLEQGAHNVRVRMSKDGGDVCQFESIILQSNNLIYKDNYFMGFLILLLAGVLAYCFLMLSPKQYGVPVILVAFGMLASLPLLSESLLGGDDLQFHMTRLEGLAMGLAAGEFPVRITPQQMEGYGGLTATMYPQLFLYPFAMLRLLDVSLMNCYKLLLCCINVGTAFLAYYAARNVCKSNRIALLMSFFYTFSLYRLTNMYTRAALGEVLAMTFLPVLIWGVYEILWGTRRWLVLVLGMTGVLGAHILTVEMCALFMLMELIFWFFSKKKNQMGGRFVDGLKAVGVTLLLNAGFLVPFLYFCGEDLQCFMIPPEVSDSGAYFSQMFSLLPSALGRNYCTESTQGELPISVGLVLLLGIFVFVYAYRKNDEDSAFGVGKHCLVMGILALVLSSWLFPWSKFETIDVLSMLCSSLQFAWRFLSLASVFLCMTLSIGLNKIMEESESYKYITVLAVGLTVIAAWNIFDELTVEQFQYTDTMQLEEMDLADGMYMYRTGEKFEALQLGYHREEGALKTYGGTAIQFRNYVRKGSGLTADVVMDAGKEEYVLFPVYWYPGYKVFVDGQEVESEQYLWKLGGRISGEIEMIEVKYVGFWFYKLADIISWLTCAVILGIGVHRLLFNRKDRSLRVMDQEEGSV